MDEKEYMEQRLGGQITFYSDASRRTQRRYKWLKAFEIASAAAVPVVVVTAELCDDLSYVPSLMRWLAAALGAAVAIISGIQGVCKFQENWMAYRTTCEMLKHERYFYETGCGPYQGAKDKLCLLVQRVEELISRENTNWQRYMKEDGESREPATA